MKTCTRFATEGLLRLEQGKPLDAHFDTCPDCRSQRRAYEELQRAITQVDADLEPSPGWRARVWEAIDENNITGTLATPRWMFDGLLARLSMRWLVPAATVLVMATVATVWLRTSPGEVRLTSTVLEDGSTLRGDDPHPGDVLQVRASTAGARFADLRVYFNSVELVVNCSSEPPCRRSGDSIELDLQIESVGTYQAVLFLASRPLPEPTEDLDGDAGAALEMGARVEPGEQVVVR